MKKMVDLDILSGWGLTEMDTGSNASQLETSCKKTEGGYLINGNKRWIGNGNRDICFVWARDQEDKKVKCFIVD
jgi:alkylation response protein AidB-like acyl-CoA dehydrogenase